MDFLSCLPPESPERTARSPLERLGIHPPLLWGYVGLLLFMIGDGVESGYLSPYLIDRGIASEQGVAMVFTAYGVAVAIAAWLSRCALGPLGPAAGDGLRAGDLDRLRSGLSAAGCAPGNYSRILVTYCFARLRISAVRLRIPGLDLGGHARADGWALPWAGSGSRSPAACSRSGRS